MHTLKTLMLRVCQNNRSSHPEIVEPSSSRGLSGGSIFLFLFLIIFFGSLSLYLGQDISWDLLNYHYYNGFAVMHHRHAIDVAPALMQTYLNPIFDLWNYAILSLPSAKMAVFVLGLHSAIIGFFLYRITALLFSESNSKWNCAVVLVIGMSGAGSVSLLGTTTNDQYSALFVIVAFYLLLCSLMQAAYWRRHVAISGMLIGIAIGCKLTTACYFIGLVAGLFFAVPSANKRKWIGYFTVFAVLGFLLSNGYWMVYLYRQFQNPFFPYYNNIFHSSFAPYISFNLSPAATPPTWMQIVFMPVYMAFTQCILYSERAMQDSRFLVTLILGILYLIKRKQANASAKWKLFGVFFVMSYLVWVSLFAVYRYALPLEYLTGIIILYFVQGLMPDKKWRAGFLLLLIGYFALTTHYPQWGRMNVGDRYFSVNTPSVPPHATIVIAAVPLAYVIPSFPADARFIGMTFVSLGEDVSQNKKQPHRKMLANVMKQLVENPNHSPLYSLTILKSGASGDLTIGQTARNNKRSFAILKNFGLIRDAERCQSFATNIGDELQLCPLIYKPV